MYEPGTILALKEQRPNDPETGEPFPYNRVEVVNRSPVSAGKKGDWTGPDADGVLLRALTNFGATLDEPFGKLRTLYDVESIPEKTYEAPKIRVIESSTESAGPTPEEVFAVKAPGKKPEEGETRARTSPLGEDGGPIESKSVLGEVEAPPAPPQPTAEDKSPL